MQFPAHISCCDMQSLKFRAFRRTADCRRQGTACEIGCGLANKGAMARISSETGRGSDGRRRARASFEPTPQTRTATQCRRCGGRRRDRRARAGFDIDHSEPPGSRVAISRAAGPDGARNTRGTTSNKSRKAAVCRHAKQPGHEVGLTARSGGTRNTRGTTHRRQNSGGTPREQGRQVDAPAACQLGGLGAA